MFPERMLLAALQPPRFRGHPLTGGPLNSRFDNRQVLIPTDLNTTTNFARTRRGGKSARDDPTGQGRVRCSQVLRLRYDDREDWVNDRRPVATSRSRVLTTQRLDLNASPRTAAAAVGLKVRPGRAVVVILKGTRQAPEIVLRHEIDLADAWVRESMHPYHQELGDRGSAGEQARRHGCEAACHAAQRAVHTFLDEMRSHGLEPCGVALVAASIVDPERITGAHARAHAREDKLYREAVESTLAGRGLRVVTYLEKNLGAVAARRLRRTAQQIDATLKAFSHRVGTPWRALEKHAALAAWLVLAR